MYIVVVCLARDAEERQKWISNLEEAISLNSVNTVCLIIFKEKQKDFVFLY